MNWFDYGRFDMQVNGVKICTAFGDVDTTTVEDSDHTGCSAVAIVAEGKQILTSQFFFVFYQFCLFLFISLVFDVLPSMDRRLYLNPLISG